MQEKTIGREMLKVCCMIVLFFGISNYMCYATDTYATFRVGFGVAARDMFYRNGRIIIALIYKIHRYTGWSNESFYYISSILSMVFLTASVFIFERMLVKYIPEENIRIIVSFLSIANIFIIEFFMFIEKCGFILAVLFAVAGVCCQESFFRTGRWLYYAFVVFCTCVSMFTYQGVIALFVILSIPFAYKYADNLKAYIKNMLFVGTAYAVPVVLCLIAFKFVFRSSRMNEELHLIDNCLFAWSCIRKIFIGSMSILPKYVFGAVTLSVVLCVAIMAFCSSKPAAELANVALIILASCVFPFASTIQGSGWPSMRVVYPIASIVGVLILNYMINHTPREEKRDYHILRKTIGCIMSIALVLLLVMQYASFNRVFIDKYKLNYTDRMRAQYVGQTIEEHQNTTGNEIKRIAVYYDRNSDAISYPGLFFQGDLLYSSFYTSWSDVASLNYYLGTNYARTECSEEYTDYFSSMDWNNLSKDQLIFEGDTLHMCVY